MAKEKKRILIVDDEVDNALLCKIILEEEKEGYEVDTFDNPLLALSSFKADFYDLLILDIKMPQMNGIELYRKIKEIDNKPKVCFFTTNYYDDIEKQKDVDTKCFISHPFENEQLIRIVKNVLI